MIIRVTRGRRAWVSRRFFADGGAAGGGAGGAGSGQAGQGQAGQGQAGQAGAAGGQAGAPAAFVNPDGTYAADWLKHPAVPEDLRGNVQLATHKSFADTLKNWATLEKIRGHTVVPVPAENSDEATWGLVYDRLGRPKDPTGYTLPDATKAGIPKDQQASPEFVQGIMADAHKAGLTNRQFTMMLDLWNHRIAGMLTTLARDKTNAETAALEGLHQEWPGQTFPANQALAAQFVRSTAKPEDAAAIEAAGLLKNPAVLRWVHGLTGQIREAEPNLDVTVTTDMAASAETEIQRIENEVGGPLYNDLHPQHAATLKRYKELKAVVARAKKPAG